jgi:uncharacterized protein involved in outer membrane biogenesis
VQTTLLGLGIAIILALVAALVGPHFVDWNQYRSVFEANASRLTGVPVRVHGKIDVRLLPTPSVVLRDIEAVSPREEPLVRAAEFRIELALGNLMRGEWRATEAQILKPEFALALDVNGRLDWPGGTPAFDPNGLAIERLAIEDGRAVLIDIGSSTRRVLTNLWFRGDVKSLLGPYKGEGGFAIEHARYGYRVSTGRLGEDGVRVKLGIDTDRPMSIESDGMLRFEQGSPRFEGAVTLTRPVDPLATASAGPVADPWRASVRVKASPAGAVLDQVEVLYGVEDRAIKLIGTAEFTFGAAPLLAANLSARQLDLDRALGLPEETRRLPAAATRKFAESFGTALRLPFPVRLGVNVDKVMLAGAGLLNVHGDVESDGDAWTLRTLEFRAPGFTQVRVNGRLALGPDGATFTGPAAMEAGDPKGLLAWLEGRDAPLAQTTPLKASGEITLGSERVAVDRLKAEFDRKAIEGRLAYVWASAGRPPRLDAEIVAPELDIDGALAFARAASAGTGIEMPGEVTLALDLGRATVAGIEAKGAKAKLKLDADGLTLERVSVADLGGAAVDLNGRIDGLPNAPRGTVTLNLDAGGLDGVTAIVAKFAPGVADALRRASPRLTPAKLRGVLDVEPRAPGASADTAKLSITGTAGASRVTVTADARGEAATPVSAEFNLAGRIEADNGTALATLFGLDQAVIVDQRPGALNVIASGRLDGEVRLDGRFNLGGLELAANGALRPGSAGAMGNLEVFLAVANARLPRTAGPAGQAIPITIKTRLAVGRDAFTLDDLTGLVAGSPVRGRLVVTPGQPLRIGGSIEADSIDAAALIATAAGAAGKTQGATATWPAEPFRGGPFSDLTGQVEVRAASATLTPAFTVRQLKGVARFGEETSFEATEGSIAGGGLTGSMVLRNGAEGLTARIALALKQVDMAALFPDGGQPPVTGRVTTQVEMEGAGLSPAAMIGSLRGSGSVTLEQAQLGGLDPRVFAMVTRAVDQGLAIDAAKIKDTIAGGLDMGRLVVPRLDAGFAIAAGQIRWGNVIATGDGADLTIGGSFDLSEWLLDARLTLSGPAESPTGLRPDILVNLRGVPTAPQRSVDAAALTSWLMLRAVERESRRLEALQAERSNEAPPPVNQETAPAVRVAPTAARTAPAEEAPETPRARPRTPAPGPRSAVAPPTAAIEPTPDQPAPTDIRPVPGAATSGAAARKTTKSGATKPQTGAIDRPPADIPPSRSLLDQLFGTQR